jgi:hypothetical protein
MARGNGMSSRPHAWTWPTSALPTLNSSASNRCRRTEMRGQAVTTSFSFLTGFAREASRYLYDVRDEIPDSGGA